GLRVCSKERDWSEEWPGEWNVARNGQFGRLAKSRGVRRNPQQHAGTGANRQEKAPTVNSWGLQYWWWGGNPRQTTVESTRYRRSGKLISPAGCCEKRGLTGQRQRTIKRFFPWIGHRYGRSNSYASLVRFDSGIGN